MTEFDILRVVVVLLLVLGMIAVCGWLAKRTGLAGITGKGTSLRISSRLPLGARSSIVVLDVEDARLVLGITAQSINLLHTLPPGADAPEGAIQIEDSSPPFKRLFQQLTGQRDGS